jgi:predicted dithiol-disulfide oxidoreductase (DUF899 family)
MEQHKVVSRSEWVEARKQFLGKEKEFTKLRDQLSQQRRDLPWERVDKEYVFEGPNGKETLAQLFDGRSQLIVYHFMFGPDWEKGCPSCSFWADNFNGIIVHLNQRDVTMLAISKAPFANIEAFKKRMGWRFKWLSSLDSSFNHDYHVSFTPEDVVNGEIYSNYAWRKTFSSELPGISVFYRDRSDNVFHTYSCYQRGLDMMNAAYHYLDLVPNGRNEADQRPHPQAWVRYHDSYDN